MLEVVGSQATDDLAWEGFWKVLIPVWNVLVPSWRAFCGAAMSAPEGKEARNEAVCLFLERRRNSCLAAPIFWIMGP